MSARDFNKYPSENRTFAIDWAQRLSNANDGSADTIATSTWAIPSGITKESDSLNGDKAIVRISGGTVTKNYKLKNTIILTTSGYTLVEYINVCVNSEPIP